MSDRYLPIADYALLSDCHSAALVSRDGSIDWACFQRFDAPSTFARVLDRDAGGHCSLGPVGGRATGRTYVGDTMVLQTTHEAEGSAGRATDFFSISDRSHAEDPHDVHPHHQLIRIAEATDGAMEWEFACRPRFEYGIVFPRASLIDDHHALLVGGPEALSVSSSVPLQADDGEVRARFRLSDGAQAWFVVTRHRAHNITEDAPEGREVIHRLENTLGFWERWASQCTYEGIYRAEVIRSALTLKALTNAPTGAIVAAPTTSLPEETGGIRNWDYRYCWVRDATFTLYALFSVGFTGEAEAFLEWLERTTAGRPRDLQVLYGIGGERRLPEIELNHLEGYRNSRPVRIGNGAATQFQLDIYGEILDTAHLWRKHGGEFSADFWSFLRGCVDEIADRWREPDESIWEVRGGSAHFLYSKVMCWVGVDRAIKAAEALGLEAPMTEWRALRDEIRTDIETNGVDPVTGHFVQAYGRSTLDASSLLLPLVGFVPPTDPRMIATVDGIRTNLSRDGLVYRYLGDDGLAGDEGTFTICSFWMVDNLAMMGRRAEARELFERLCSLANDVGLFGEEIDPATGEHMGNFPQAFTHLALINSALNLARAPSA